MTFYRKHSSQNTRITKSILFVIMLVAFSSLLLSSHDKVYASSRQSLQTFPSPTWTDTVGAEALSSPTIAVIDNVQVLVFGSESGYIYVLNAATGQNMPGWPEPVEIAQGQPTAIESSPTVAYLNGKNSPPSIIVGAGSTYVADQQGGLEVFNANGTVKFIFHTLDIFNEWTNAPYPSGYDQAVFATPAVGDVQGNGQQDIVFGSWDHRIYALSPNGKLLPGFPIDNQDTIWSSVALYHVHGPKRADDIFLGGDSTGRRGCYGGWIMDYAFTGGYEHRMWEHCENQTVWSSPAVGIINGTGQPAVVVGTGFGEPPPYKSDSYKLFAFYAKNGRPVPGWPVNTAGPSFGSPAIGYLSGSNTPAVVDTSWCMACSGAGYPNQGASKVYAWSGNGHLIWSQTLLGGNDFSSPILVNLTGSGENDVLVGSSAGLYPLSGATGSFLFGTSMQSAINNCSLQSTPLVAYLSPKLSGSGTETPTGNSDKNTESFGWHVFETCGGPKEVSPSGKVFSYPLPDTPSVAPAWPMWRQNQNHTGVAASTLHR